MSNVTVCACPNCGASIGVQITCSNVKCEYCGSMLMIKVDPASGKVNLDFIGIAVDVVAATVSTAVDLGTLAVSVLVPFCIKLFIFMVIVLALIAIAIAIMWSAEYSPIITWVGQLEWNGLQNIPRA